MVAGSTGSRVPPVRDGTPPVAMGHQSVTAADGASRHRQNAPYDRARRRGRAATGNRQIQKIETELTDQFEQDPEAEIYQSTARAPWCGRAVRCTTRALEQGYWSQMARCRQRLRNCAIGDGLGTDCVVRDGIACDPTGRRSPLPNWKWGQNGTWWHRQGRNNTASAELQNRCGAASQSWVGSTPTHSRQAPRQGPAEPRQ